MDWVQAKMDGNSASVSPRSSLSLKVFGLDPDSPAVDGLVVGTSIDGLAESPLEFEGLFSASVSLTVTRLDPDSPAVDRLEVGICSDGPAVAPMEFKGFLSAGFNSNGPAVA